MSCFTIAGRSDCKFFIHALYVANCLSDHLPNFKVRIIKKKSTEWERWLWEINNQNDWNHYDSPITWKELTGLNSKPYLIGGLSEFWEYCYDYYGLASVLTKEQLEKLTKDYIQHFKKEDEGSSKTLHRIIYRTICIIGNEARYLTLLRDELLALKDSFENCILNVKVYDETNDNIWRTIRDDISEDISESSSIFSICNNSDIDVVSDVKEGISNCDLLIITGDFTRKDDEDLYDWLLRSGYYMQELSEKINAVAKRNIRIAVATTGPVCFQANVLVETATKIEIRNIVAVTADLSLQALNFVSKSSGLPLEDLGAPPVWGFIGINHIVDVGHIIGRDDVYKPKQRKLLYDFASGSSPGNKCTEFRYISDCTDDVNAIWPLVNKTEEYMTETLYRLPYFPKIRAITSLVRNWYSQTSNGNIISLGILSDGSFGIPSGVIFSQPVILQDNYWIPMTEIPVPKKDPFCFKDLVPFASDIMCWYKYFS